MSDLKAVIIYAQRLRFEESAAEVVEGASQWAIDEHQDAFEALKRARQLTSIEVADLHKVTMGDMHSWIDGLVRLKPEPDDED